MSEAPSALVAAYLKKNPGFDPLHDHVLPAATAPAATRVRATAGAAAAAPRVAPAAADTDSTRALQGYQRVLRVVSGPVAASAAAPSGKVDPVAAKLLDGGVDSAHKIAAVPKHDFVAAQSAALPGGAAQARAIHANAQHVKAQATHMFALVRDQVASPHTRATLFKTSPADATAAFQQVPGYNELFGSLDYCPCGHSDSIIGPGAYFVDLMRITDAYITGPNAATIPAGQKLEDRRPDLFDLPITAANADTEIPFLTIVTEVLERNLASTPDLAYQSLAVSGFPFGLPFTLPQARIRANLDQLGTSLGDVGSVLRPVSWSEPYPLPPPALAGEILGLGASEWTLYTQASVPDWLLQQCYGIDGHHGDSLAAMSDVPTFLDRTGLQRGDLDALLGQGLSDAEVTAGAAGDLYVNKTRESGTLVVARSGSDSGETLANLTNNRLWRLSTFIRLSRALGWTFEEFDWIIRCANAGAVNANLVQRIAQMKEVGLALGETSPIPLAALFADLKTSGQGNGPARADFFDTVFNNPAILAGRDPYATGSSVPFNPAAPVTWTISDRSGVNNEIRSRLGGALQVSDDDLTLIADWTSAITGQTTLTTDLATLSLLYRMARLPRLLGLQVSAFLHLMGLMFAPATAPTAPAAKSYVVDLDTLGGIAAGAAWLKAQPFTVYELEWSLTGRSGPDFRPPDPVTGLSDYIDSLATQSESIRVRPGSLALGTVTPDQAAAVFNALTAANVLTPIGLVIEPLVGFADVAPALPLGAAALTVPGITDAEASAALTALVNNKILTGAQAADGSVLGYLAAQVTAATKLDFLFPGSSSAAAQQAAVLQVLMQAGANVAAVVDLLSRAQARQVAAALGGLAARLQLTPEVVSALLPFASATLTASALMPMLLTPLNGAALPNGLSSTVLALARYGLIAARLNLAPAELNAIGHNPGGFSVTTPQALTFADVRAISHYKDLAAQYQDNALVLAGCVFSSSGSCQQTGIDALAAVTAWPADQITALAKQIWGGNVAWTVHAVATLKRCFDLAARLGGDVSLLTRLNGAIGTTVMTIPGPSGVPGDRQIGVLDSGAWATLTALADATLDAVNARYRDASFAEASGRIEGKMLTARRDALLGTVIWKLSGTPTSLAVKTPSDLYQFLLLDVEMSGCKMTSRVIQATAAVQLYMQRCRMGLETGVIQFPFDPDWWDWMSSYRIWEVNRKIFLYPENYLDPTLRRNITPPFAALKQRLQQSDLTDAAVEDAYRAYFNEVETLGTLRMVDGYNVGDVDPGSGNRIFMLWLFARTGTEPYTYYFRTFDGTTWAPWQKIEHSVPSAVATPVYAFNTPYLFWTESSTTQSHTISSGSSQAFTTTKSTTKFIRRRSDGSWSPPQALVTDTVIGFQADYDFDIFAAAVLSNPLYTQTFSPALFDLTQARWHKPIVLFVPAETTVDPALPKIDRLMTALGFATDVAQNMPYGAVPPVPNKIAPDQAAFDSAICTMASRINDVAGPAGSASGSFPFIAQVQFGTLHVVDARANRQTSQLTLLENPSDTTSYVPVSASIDRAGGTFGLRVRPHGLTATFAYDDYPGQSPVFPGPINFALLKAANRQLASAVTIKNQFSWFLLDNGDEAFLVQPDGVPFPTLTEIMNFSQNVKGLPSTESYLRVEPIVTRGHQLADAYRFTRLSTHTIPLLAQRLAATGLPGLLTIDAQNTPELDFARLQPTSIAVAPESTTLDFNGAMGDYFREIFFHVPFLVASTLNASRRFDQAQQWLQYIFNPTAPPQPSLARPTDRVWNYLPFRNLAADDMGTDLTNSAQIAAYNNSPFDPDAITGLRPAAYAKATAMRYISNLLDWADQLFREFTRETVNEATNLYVMASDLLGPRPREVGGRVKPAPMSFRQMRTAGPGGLVPEFLINTENLLSAAAPGTPSMQAVPFNDVNSYFCVPENDEFVGYWDRVESQLYKIRHCMNIDGQYQTLPLLAPPLDVRAVIAAAAAADGGLPLDAGAALPIPAYRFEALLGRARAIADDVMRLGAQVQTALERQDAEQLELLRNVQEKNLLDLTTEIRNLQIKELESTQGGLQTSLASANARYDYYDGLVQQGLSEAEKLNLAMLIVAQVLSTVGGVLKTMSGVGYLVPQIGSPFAMTYGGQQVGSSLTSIAEFFDVMASQASFVGNVALLTAGYERRAAEWGHERTLADYDRKQIQQQLDAAGFQLDGAKQELQVHLKTLAQNGELAAYLTGKFTSGELYQWLLGRLAAMHYQTYTLAYDLARMVERALQYELNSDQSYLQFGYWDNVRKGLTAGEGLQLALNRMERAWLDGNVRTLEIRRTVALSQLDPLALVQFRTTGSCEFALTEKLFDYDYPGHYCRKIKTISVSIPAVVGPWQTVNATLTQLSNQVVIKPNASAINFLLGGDAPTPDASVLRSNWSAYQQIALSSGLSDSGLFQLDFRDERYLPFEGTGAVSRWRLDMPPATNRIDFEGIADVIVEIGYTALDGGAALRSQVTALAAMQPFTGQVLLPIRDLQPDAWNAFLADHGNTATQTLNFTVPLRAVPPHVKSAVLSNVTAILRISATVQPPPTPPTAAFVDYQITPALATSQITVGGKTGLVFDPNWLAVVPVPQTQQPAMSDVAGQHSVVFTLTDVPDTLKTGGFIDPGSLDDLILLLDYQGAVQW